MSLASKWKPLLRRVGDAALLGGLMVAAAGAYDVLVRAGIPYQDPTPAMQIQYAIDMGVGRALLSIGLILMAGGGIARLLSKHI